MTAALAGLPHRHFSASEQSSSALETDERDISALVETTAQGRSRVLRLGPGNFTVAAGTRIDNFLLEGAGPSTVLRRRGGNGDYLLEARGHTFDLGPLAYPVRRGSTGFVLSREAKLSPGDLIQFYDPAPYSLSQHRNVYRAGQFSRVLRVEGQQVFLTSPIKQDLAAGHTKINAVKGMGPTIRNLKIDADNLGALRCSLCEGTRLEGLIVRNASDHGIYIDRCSDFEARSLNIVNNGRGSGSDYGLAIGNSEDGLVVGGTFLGRRHGISIGGGSFENSIPCRSIEIARARIANDSLSGVMAADVHGNCINTSFRGCSIEGGANIGGCDARFIGCSITANPLGVCLYGTEIRGGTFQILNCDLTSQSDAAKRMRGLIDFGGDSVAIGPETQGPVSVLVHDCRVIATGQSEKSRVVEIRNRGSNWPINVSISRLSLEVDDLGAVLSLRNHSAGKDWDGEVHVNQVLGLPEGALLRGGVIRPA